MNVRALQYRRLYINDSSILFLLRRHRRLRVFSISKSYLLLFLRFFWSAFAFRLPLLPAIDLKKEELYLADGCYKKTWHFFSDCVYFYDGEDEHTCNLSDSNCYCWCFLMLSARHYL